MKFIIPMIRSIAGLCRPPYLLKAILLFVTLCVGNFSQASQIEARLSKTEAFMGEEIHVSMMASDAFSGNITFCKAGFKDKPFIIEAYDDGSDALDIACGIWAGPAWGGKEVAVIVDDLVGEPGQTADFTAYAAIWGGTTIQATNSLKIEKLSGTATAVVSVEKATYRADISGKVSQGVTEVRIMDFQDRLLDTVPVLNGAYEYKSAPLAVGSNIFKVYGYHVTKSKKEFHALLDTVDAEVLPPPTWVSPSENSDYYPSHGKPLVMTGQTNIGVEWVQVWSERQNEPDSVSHTWIPITPDNKNHFTIEVPGSKEWVEGRTYLVSVLAQKNGIDSNLSNHRQIRSVASIPPPAPTWIGPADNSWYGPSKERALTVSGKTEPDVEQVTLNWRDDLHHDVGVVYIKREAIQANGEFIVEVPSSKTWDKKRYEITFTAQRYGKPSVASEKRTFHTTLHMEWLTPTAGSDYLPSDTNAFKIGGKTEAGVDGIEVWSSEIGTDEWDKRIQPVTLNADHSFTLEVGGSTHWIKGKRSVKFRGMVAGIPDPNWQDAREFEVVRYPTTLIWLSPDDNSQYTPSAGQPLRISGRTDPGVTEIHPWWRVLGGGNGSYSDTVITKLDQDNSFKEIPVSGSDGWAEGTTYEVQFKVVGKGALHSNWSAVRRIHVPYQTPLQPTWTNPDKQSWQNFSKDNPLTIRGQTQPGVDKIQVLWQSKSNVGNTAFEDIGVLDGDGNFSFPLEVSKDWEDGSTYTVSFIVQRHGVASAVSEDRIFHIDKRSPLIANLQQSMSDSGNYSLSATVTDNNSGLGPAGDGKNAMDVRWRTDASAPWSLPSKVDVSPSNIFLFGLSAEQLKNSWMVEVEIIASDRAGNQIRSPLRYVEQPLIKLDASRTDWKPANSDTDEKNTMSGSAGDRSGMSGGSEMFAGDTFSYSITVLANKGKAENINLTYLLPNELEMFGKPRLIQAANTSTVLNTDWNGTATHSLLMASGAYMNAKATVRISVPVRIKWDAVSSPKSHIAVHADGITDLGYSDAVTLVPYQGALKLVKSVDKDSAHAGDTLVYTISFRNTSNTFIAMEEIQDPVDARMTLQDVHCGADIPPDLTCSARRDETAAVWNFSGRLPAGGAGSLKYSATIDVP